VDRRRAVASVARAVDRGLVGRGVRLTRLYSPRAEQWAWLLVLVQGVLLVPVSISIPWESRGSETSPPRRQADVIPIDAARPPMEDGRGKLGGDEGREPAPRPENTASPRSEPAAGPIKTGVRFSWFVAAFAAWLAGVCSLLALEPVDGRARVMAFSPDGKRLFTGSERGIGVVWDVTHGQEAPNAKE